jgi:hypothetical protein
MKVALARGTLDKPANALAFARCVTQHFAGLDMAPPYTSFPRVTRAAASFGASLTQRADCGLMRIDHAPYPQGDGHERRSKQ